MVSFCMEQSKDHILKIINEYNFLMKEAITGPNCIDPTICHGDCCHIQIDISKLLAEYYIEKEYACKEDFIRGDLFSFKIKVNSSNSKCVFYDSRLNGCSLHKSMCKPPQCWIYPTGFNKGPGEEKKFADDGSIKCKIASGWNIINPKNTSKAKLLFEEYVVFCENELISETTKERIKERLEPLFQNLKKCPPKSIAGITDLWDQFDILKSEGISLKLKSLCENISDHTCNCAYIDCNNVCDEIVDFLRQNLLDDVCRLIKSNGAKEFYSFLELWNSKIESNNVGVHVEK